MTVASYARQAMYVLRTFETLSCSHYGCEKLRNIAYSEGVFVALVIQHALRMHHNHLWPARLYHNIRHSYRFPSG
jgi:hypothetical protein